MILLSISQINECLSVHLQPSISPYSPHLKNWIMSQALVQTLCLGNLQTKISLVMDTSCPPSSSIKFRLPGKGEVSMCGVGVVGNWFTSGLWRRFGFVGMYASREVLLQAYTGTGPLGQTTSMFSHGSEPRWPGKVSTGNLQLFPGSFRKISY